MSRVWNFHNSNNYSQASLSDIDHLVNSGYIQTPKSILEAQNSQKFQEVLDPYEQYYPNIDNNIFSQKNFVNTYKLTPQHYNQTETSNYSFGINTNLNNYNSKKTLQPQLFFTIIFLFISLSILTAMALRLGILK